VGLALDLYYEAANIIRNLGIKEKITETSTSKAFSNLNVNAAIWKILRINLKKYKINYLKLKEIW